ncbi:uncharacterized protein LOC124889657 [Capsicum annuum]|uniref:uncharacterized protein LOC124889657 n=1 Tax=Capsicum annuum TaxID=4072 RepID=UPI001FB113A8|nr:uncharacterized protein LOC124889657 [Capsicum annuum]
MKLKEAAELRLGQLNELDEFRLEAYERVDLYKERMKNYHDQRIEKRDFQASDWVLLFNSQLKLFSSELKSRWSGPFKESQVFPSGIVELEGMDGSLFKVNG